MIAELPKPLRRALWCQFIAVVLLCLSLLSGRALPFVITIGGGCAALALAIIFFFMFYMGAVKRAPEDAGEVQAAEATEGETA